MDNYKTEDANVRDAVNTMVNLYLRTVKRQMVDKMLSELTPKIEKARLKGQEVDLNKLVQGVARNVFNKTD